MTPDETIFFDDRTKKPNFGYILWSIFKRHNIKEKNYDMTPCQIVKELRKQWINLSLDEHNIWNDEAYQLKNPRNNNNSDYE